MSAEVAKIGVHQSRRGEGAGGKRQVEPTQAEVRRGRRVVRFTSGANPKYALDVHVGDAVRARDVGGGSRKWESRKEVRIAVGGAFAVDESVAEVAQVFQPTADARIVLSDFDDAGERLVIGVDFEVR